MEESETVVRNRFVFNNDELVIAGFVITGALVITFLVSVVMTVMSLFGEPSWYNAFLAAYYATLVLVLGALLRFGNILLILFCGKKLPSDTFESLCWVFLALLGPTYITIIGLIPQIGISVQARVLIFTLMFYNLSQVMVYKVADMSARAALLAKRALDYGWLVTAGIVVTDYAIRHNVPITIWQMLGSLLG